jgi:Ca2+-binding EF-hand superfamily protein
MARRVNLDPSAAMPIDKLVSGSSSYGSSSNNSSSSDRDRDRDRDRGDSDRDRDRDRDRERERERSSSSSSSTAKPATPTVQGFGTADATPRAAGFDVPLSVDTTVPLEKRYDGRVLEYVDRMLKDQDKNKDGFIDSVEWKDGRWSTPPEESDTNKDSRLSRAELCERIARRFGLTSPPGSSSNSGSSSSSDRSRSGSSENRSSGSSDGSSSSSDAAKYKQYAESLIRQFDKNKNGMLEKDEFSEMKSEHRAADMNSDGVITLDELTAKLQSYSSGSSSSSGGSSSSSYGSRNGSSSSSGGTERRSWFGSKTGSSTTKPTDKKGYRLSTPTEKLPKGLPEWFLRNDADADGQIAMVEYASTWTDQMAADFLKYDLNSDGYITPEECLAADKKK